jgi:hypothetical protein
MSGRKPIEKKTDELSTNRDTRRVTDCDVPGPLRASFTKGEPSEVESIVGSQLRLSREAHGEPTVREAYGMHLCRPGRWVGPGTEGAKGEALRALHQVEAN